MQRMLASKFETLKLFAPQSFPKFGLLQRQRTAQFSGPRQNKGRGTFCISRVDHHSTQTASLRPEWPAAIGPAWATQGGESTPAPVPRLPTTSALTPNIYCRIACICSILQAVNNALERDPLPRPQLAEPEEEGVGQGGHQPAQEYQTQEAGDE